MSKRRWGNKEIADVCESLISGETAALVGVKYGVSPSRAMQIFYYGIRRIAFLTGASNNAGPWLSLDYTRSTSKFWISKINQFKLEQQA